MARALHVSFCGCHAGVEVFEDHFFAQIRTPCEEPLSDDLEEGQDFSIAQ